MTPIDKYESENGTPVVVVGQTGDSGPKGAPGRRGEPGVISTRKALTLAGFVVAVFLLLAYRSEMNADAIKTANHHNAVQAYAQCVASRTNADGLNRVLDQIIVSVETRKDLSDAQRSQFQAIYRNAKPRVPDCGTQP